MKEAVCPYCFRRFKQSEVLFRCQNPYCAKNEQDSVLDRYYFEQQGKMGHVFRGKSRLLGLFSSAQGVCPACRTESNVMVCPHCHNNLDPEVVKTGHIISIIGARGSGKTIYITSMIEELRRRGDQIAGLGLFAADFMHIEDYRTPKHYEKDFYVPVFGEKRCPPQTMIGDKANRFPLLYKLGIGEKKKGDATFLVLYDTAGENFKEMRYVEENVKYLNQSDAILFLVDTESIPYVHDKLQVKDDIELRYDVILDTIIRYIRQKGGANNAIFKKPVAMVFTKIDRILTHEREFEDTAISGMSIQSNSSFLNGEGISLSEIDNNSDSIRAALSVWREGNFVNVIKQNFENVRYFGVSSLGSNPDTNKKITERITPYRVLDPLMWILHELKFPLPLKKG